MSNTTEQPALVGQVEPTVMQHTPGPWVTYGHRKLFVMSEFTAIEIGGVNRFEANAEANASLIAAAPDLLAALRECLTCEFAVTDKAAIAKAESAIARAVGAG